MGWIAEYDTQGREYPTCMYVTKTTDTMTYVTTYVPIEDWRVVQAENDKLRELCADIYEMAYYEYPSAFETAFADRMHELEIEVS